MLRDFRLALRMLRKQPGFSLIAIVTLALGIGATAAVFSLIQGVLLTPPPYNDPGRLVLIPSVRADSQPAPSRGWAPAQWLEWQKEAKSFDSIAGYGWTFNFLISEEGSESLEGMAVTGDYFRVAGLEPALGRKFLPSETQAGSPPGNVIILGHEFWQRKFNGDGGVLGKPFRLSRRQTPPTIIGVMPPGVRFFPSPGASKEPNYNVDATVDFLLPASINPQSINRAGWNLAGRLRPGVTPEQAQAELVLLAERESQADPQFAGFVPRVQPLADEMNHDGNRILIPLLGAAGLVLLIACGNVAALLLVRGLQRQQEYAVRSALGIGRTALFRQVCTESLLLALAGGGLGTALALGGVQVIKAIGGHAIPRLDAVTTGWPVLAAGLALGIASALFAGFVPALRASRMDPMQAIKSGGPNSSAGRTERRLLRGVTVAQTALTLTLLVGAGLMIRTMRNVDSVRAGYDTTRVLTMSVTAVQGNGADFHRRALERVSAIPGVEHAAFAWGVPLTGNNWPGSVELEGQPEAAKPSDRISIPLRSVTPGYFAMLGQSIVDGRDFRSSDGRDAPRVVVVNQALVARYFPESGALGKKAWLFGRDQPPAEIVGIATNGRTDDLTEPAGPEVYVSFWQMGAFSKHLAVRTAADPRQIAGLIRNELRAVDPTAAVENVQTLDQIRSQSLAPRSFAMQLLLGFAGIASVLTLVGIYGVLALSVASRRREIAIRSAVGADAAAIRQMILSEGLGLIGVGVVGGLAAALLVSRVLRTFLFGVEAADPVTFAAAGLLFAGAAAAACWTPALRASRVNPIEALRQD
ncbi:MAG: ABC transporter permease [Bryobacteraceae bacterium]